jgi:hypothetical protein
MSKTAVLLSGFVILLCVAATTMALDKDWTNASGDRLWRNTANWSGGICPTSDDKAAIRNDTIDGPIIDSSTMALANYVVLGDWASTHDTVTVTGGSLTTTEWFILGYYIQNNGTLTVSGGTVDIGSYMHVGFGGTGTVTISGGSIAINGQLNVAQPSGGTGTVNINGGTLSAGSLSIYTGGKINITAGTLIVDGNQIGTLQAHEANHRLVAYNGGGKCVYDYNNINPGKTTVTAIASSTISWDNGGGDNLWTTAANWNPNTVPDLSIPILIFASGASPQINEGMTATAFQIRVGASGGATLTMNGGELDASEWLMIGTEESARTGTFVMNSGTVNLGNHLWIGYTGYGTLTMNSGTINALGRFGMGFMGGSANVHLDGGTINAAYFSMTSLCHLDITNGKLIIDGDQTALINGYKSSGLITAFGGSGKVNCEYNEANNNKTTVTAEVGVVGDIDGSGDVNIDDLILFAANWLDPDTANIANIDKTGRVDFKDYSLLASNYVRRPIMNWHVVTTQYPTDDLVISPYNAPDFGIVSDGVTDVTAAIQKALNSISDLGGGTLFLPAGNYRINGHLLIPTRVTLRGDWQKPEIGSAITGTILQAYESRGNAGGTSFIRMSTSSGLRGVAIWYPEQLPGDIRPYPPAIQRVSGGFQTIEDITFVNAYFGFTTYNNSIGFCPMVRNIYGTPLKTGIELDCLADIGRLESVHFSPDYWRYSGLPNSPTANEHAQWIYDNGTGIIIRRVDWSYFAYAQVEGYNIGVAVRPSLYDGVAPNAQCYDFTISNCNTGIYFENCSAPGMLLSRFDIEGAQVGVHLAGTESGVAMFHTFVIDASDKAVFNEGSGPVMLQNCQFNNKVVSNNGYLTVVNSDFGAAATSHIEIENGVKGASIVGDRFVGTPQIVNNTTYPVYINHTPVNAPALPEYNYKKPQQAFKPATSNLYVVTKLPYNAKGDGVNDDTTAFETAIADAAANGGGTVFVPGGNYRLTRNLIIPTGVELRGMFDVPHSTMATGSVLNIYPGHGEENGTPFIQMQAGAGMRGLTFHYPEQIYNANDRVNYGLVPYPFMIRGLGANIYIINISATIPYQLLDLQTARCDNHFVDYIFATALKTGIQAGGGSVGGQIHNCQFNPSSYTFCAGYYASIPPGTASDIHQYLWDHGRPYVFGNMTGEVLHQNFVFAGVYGVHLVDEGGIGPSGYCLGMGADQSTTALRVDAIGSAGLDMINTQLVTVDSVNGRYIETDSSFAGTCRLFNTACWGIADHSVVVNGGSLDLELFNNVKAGAVGYDVRGTGSLICIGGDVLDYVDTLLLIEPGATANFTANVLNTSESQMPVNSANVISIGNLRMQ